MKKINIFLIIATIFLSIFTIITEADKSIVIVLKDLSIILTLTIPYIANKIFKTKFTEGFIFIWIIFIFMTHYLGVICNLYSAFQGFDKITHTISGIITAYIALIILNNVKTKRKIWDVLFIISFSALCAVCWEIFEFVCNILVGGDAQRVAATGVDDTMLDMIVALAGSIVFSVYYAIKTK